MSVDRLYEYERIIAWLRVVLVAAVVVAVLQAIARGVL